jgi:hypothetical protein
MKKSSVLPSKRLVAAHLLFPLVLLTLVGCAHTTLSRTKFNQSAPSPTPSRANQIEICVSGVPARLGYQYAALLFPVGVIDGGDSIAARIIDEIKISAARQGLMAVESCSPTALQVKVSEAAASAMDLFFVRRVSASVAGEIRYPDGALHRAFRGESAMWRRFGFKAQLDAAFGTACENAFNTTVLRPVR